MPSYLKKAQVTDGDVHDFGMKFCHQNCSIDFMMDECAQFMNH